MKDNGINDKESATAASGLVSVVQWMAGTEAPVFQEIGPYSFLVRSNVS